MNDLEASDVLRGFEVKRMILAPPNWLAFRFATTLTWKHLHFASTPATSIPDNKHGVYTFVVQPGIAAHPLCSYLLYVGKAGGSAGFRSRYYKYKAEKAMVDSDRPLVNRMVNKWYDQLWFCYAEVPSVQITDAEDELLKAYLPPFNKDFPASLSPAMRAF